MRKLLIVFTALALMSFNRTGSLSSEDLTVYASIIELAKTELGLDVEIRLGRLTGYSHNGVEIHAHVKKYDGVYYIMVKKLPKDKMIRILSHEVMHIVQYESGDLVDGGKFMTYKGKKIINSSEYEHREYEKDANSDGRILAKAIRARLR